MTTTPQEDTELRAIDYEIIAKQEPDGFIDLLNFDSFTIGNMNGKIPVHRHRLIFEQWLAKRDDIMRLDGAKTAERIIRSSPDPKGAFNKYIQTLTSPRKHID